MTVPEQITHEQARAAAQRLINSHFGNTHEEQGRTRIPAQPDDDDLLITRYIRQQEALPLMGVQCRDRETIARALYSRRTGLNAETTAAHFKLYAAQPNGIDNTRMAVFRAYLDADTVCALPAHSGSVQCREDVARIIDPIAFDVRNTWMELGSHQEDREKAFAKADLILSLSKPAGQPVEGWRLVPVEPTPDMRIAGGIAWSDALPTAATYVDTADACYKAMLSAAPASPHEVHERETPVVKPIGQEK